ncbi:hypothetical protein HK100_012202 [Physocladia obscura]|uniref:Nuclear pore protein n=1 Tax=Physocladia obscura TaxID=109957 RepID=A0AAD5T9V6_9FUNG|nr:hypothetical protein HK100_012202 [Physocladia obscura]
MSPTTIITAIKTLQNGGLSEARMQMYCLSKLTELVFPAVLEVNTAHMNLDFLYAQSQQLTSHIVGSGGQTNFDGSIERGLASIDAQTKRLFAPAKQPQGTSRQPPTNQQQQQQQQPQQQQQQQPGMSASTAFLLATRGFDAEKVANTIATLTQTSSNTGGTGVSSTIATPNTPAEIVANGQTADIESFLLSAHQTSIANAVDAARQDAERDCLRRCDAAIHKDWTRAKKRVWDELGVSSAYSAAKTPLKNSSQSHLQYSTPARGGLAGSGIGHYAFTSVPSPMTLQQNKPDHHHQLQQQAHVSLQMLPRHRAFSVALQTINASSVTSTATSAQDVFSLFFETTSKLERAASVTSAAASSSHLGKCWRLLYDIFSIPSDSEFDDLSKAYKQLGEDGLSKSSEAVAFRKRIIEGGKTNLQNIYYEFIQQIILQNRTQIGGMPTVHTFIDSYIKIRFSKNGTWMSNVGLEISNGLAVWPHMYYLIRCGLYNEALDYCSDSAFERVVDARFSGWLRGFVSNGRVSQTGVAQIRDEWTMRIRPSLTDGKIDPFKAALYKILGRCEMNSKIIKGLDVCPSVEDYLWLQLMLIDEDASGNTSRNDRYTLRDMSAHMQKFGANHFSPQNRTPHVYFQVLLLCGEFERAVAFLYASGNSDPLSGTCALDAVHFAVALALIGCLRVPENPRGFEGGRGTDVLVTRSGDDGFEVGYLLLAKIVYGYAKQFFKSDSVEAMHYLLVLGKLGKKVKDGEDFDTEDAVVDVVGASAREYTQILHGYLRELVLANVKNATALQGLLGFSASAKDIRVGGEIEKYLPAAQLGSYADLVKFVVTPAAMEAEQKGRLADAVKLYDYAQEYTLVVKILGRQLADLFVSGTTASLQTQSSVGNVNGISSLYGQQQPYKPSLSAFNGTGVSVMSIASPATKTTVNTTEAPNDALIAAAKQQLDAYFSRPSIANNIPDTLRKTATTLISLNAIHALFVNGKHDQIIDSLRSLRLLPMNPADMAGIMRASEDFAKLDENVAKCVPTLMSVAMESLVRVYKTLKEAGKYGEAMRGGKEEECKTVGRAIILYAGNIQYRIPSDIFAKLTKLEVLMS